MGYIHFSAKLGHDPFLKLQKNCLAECVGTDLSMKRGKPASEQMCSMCQKESFYIQRKNRFIDRHGGKNTGSSIGWRC